MPASPKPSVHKHNFKAQCIGAETAFLVGELASGELGCDLADIKNLVLDHVDYKNTERHTGAVSIPFFAKWGRATAMLELCYRFLIKNVYF
jgi:hypothetical protein